MKKLLLVLPIVVLLATGCGSAKQPDINNSVVQNVKPVVSANPTNTPTTTATNQDTICGKNDKPWIKVVSPNGGEVYTIGQDITFKWETCNISSTDHITAQLDGISNPNNIKSLFGEGNDQGLLGDTVSLNDGQQTINLGPIPSTGVQWINPGTYKLTLSKFGTPSITDSSDNSFTIQKSSVSSETSSTEIFNNQPGAIKSIKAQGNNTWVLAVDLLSPNTKWLPGVDSPYINQNPKIRNLNVTSATKAYDCGTQYANGNNVGPSLQNISSFITNLQNTITQAKLDIKYRVGGPIEIMTDWALASFDINGVNITAIYQLCLP